MRTSPIVAALAVAALAVAAAACGPKPKKQCAASSTAYCVSGEVCDFNEKLGCQVCTCNPWDNGRGNATGPTGPENAPGPPIPVH